VKTAERPEKAAQQAAVRTLQGRLQRHATIQSMYGAIQEYAGFDRPEWLG
jgi:hypothetical protein